MIVIVKSWKGATEQPYYGNKTNKNDGTGHVHALNSLNFDYFIHYSSFGDEDEYLWCPVSKNRNLFGYIPVSIVHQSDGSPNHSARGML